MLDLAKAALDVGLLTNELDDNRAFWEERVGLRYDHFLKLGGGTRQHRLDLPGSVLKLNHSRPPLENGPGGYTGLRVAADVRNVAQLTSPDGLAVEVVPAGHDGIEGIEIRWSTAHPERTREFLEVGLGAVEIDGRHRLGTTWLVVDDVPGQPGSGERTQLGFRYITAQIHDVEKEHGRMLELGFDEGLAPVRLGDTAYISFVRDPDGNWLELSQRASLTGPLPDVPGGTLSA